MSSFSSSGSVDHNFYSGDSKDILGDRGHRYKRNLMTLGLAVLVVTHVDGLALDPSAVPGVTGMSKILLWRIVTAILFYNGFMYAYHIWQDWTLFLEALKRLHLGYPFVLITGTTKRWENSDGKKFMVEREGERGVRFRVVIYTSDPPRFENKSQIEADKLISWGNFLHLRRKLIVFGIVDFLLPVTVLIFSALSVMPSIFATSS